MKFTPGWLFLYASIVLLIFGLIARSALGISAYRQGPSDELQLIFPLHFLFLVAFCFGIIASVYFVYPKIFNSRSMNNRLGQVHFWISLVSLICYFIPLNKFLAAGSEIQYYNQYNYDVTTEFGLLRIVGIVALMVFLIAQIAFAFNFVRCLFRK